MDGFGSMLMLNQGVILEKGTYLVDSFFTGVEIIGIGLDIRFNLGPPGLEFVKIPAVILFRGL